MRVHVDVTEGGKTVTYNMEITSPNSVQRQGWGRNSLLPGEKVVFEGYGGKVDETRGSLLSIAKRTRRTSRSSSRVDPKRFSRASLERGSVR